MSTVPDTLLDVYGRAGVTGPMIRAAEAVFDAIDLARAGEPWNVDSERLPDAVRVGKLLIEVEPDDEGGFSLTSFSVDDGEPVTVRYTHTKRQATGRLIALIRREAGRQREVQQETPPWRWHRVKPGEYRCGGYVVGQLGTGEWFAEGPGVDRCFDHKHEAQAACAAAHTSTTPVIRR